MSFAELFKNAFLTGYNHSSISTPAILVALATAAVISSYIFFIYRILTRKTFYSETFNLSLIAMAVITAAIILTVQANLVLSLGMVGALSIVRFRTAVKDPLDLVFLYWSICVGIICGAGVAEIALIVSLVITVILFALQRYPKKKLSMILVVNSSVPESDEKIMESVKKYCGFAKIKSKNLTRTSLDLVVELRVDEETRLIHELLELEGVTSASLLSHDGEVTA